MEQYLQRGEQRPDARKLHVRFLVSPVEILADAAGGVAGLALERAVALLEKVRSRELPIDRVLLIDLELETSRPETDPYEDLERALPELDRLLRLVRRDFRAYLAPGTPPARWPRPRQWNCCGRQRSLPLGPYRPSFFMPLSGACGQQYTAGSLG